MKAGKWILVTATLAMALSAGAFAEAHEWTRGRDGDDTVYASRYHRDRDDAWTNRYRDGDRDRYNRAWTRADRDHQRRNRDDRGRDRD